MPVNLVCPTCRGVLPLPDDFAGEVVRCGNCAGLIPIPKLPAQPVAPVTPVAPAAVSNPDEIVFHESSSTSRSRHRSAANGGAKTLVVVMWSAIAAITIGTVGFAGWLLSQPKKEIVVVESPQVKSPVVSKAGAATPDPVPSPTPSSATKPAPMVSPPSPTPSPAPPPSPTPSPAPPPPPPPPPTPTPTPTPPVPVIPRAVDLAKCAMYLSFDSVNPDEVFIDSVTKRKIGRGLAPHFKLIEGKRSGAMRVTFLQRDTGGFDISDQIAKFDFRVGNSFTIAYWVRFPNPVTDMTIVFGMSGKGDAKLVTGLPDTLGQTFGVEYNHTISKSRKEAVKLSAPFLNGPGEWQHFALTRADSGKIVAYLNGVPMTGKNETTGDIANFTLAGFGFSMANRGGEFDLDELAIYSRVLPPAEVKRLAGVNP